MNLITPSTLRSVLTCFLVCRRGPRDIGRSLVRHRLDPIPRLDGDGLVGRILGWLVGLRGPSGLLGIGLGVGGDHCGVSGGSYDSCNRREK